MCVCVFYILIFCLFLLGGGGGVLHVFLDYIFKNIAHTIMYDSVCTYIYAHVRMYLHLYVCMWMCTLCV